VPHLEFRKLFHYHPHWQNGRSALYWHATLRTFGLSLIGIFLPIYVFVQARSLLGVSIRTAIAYVLIYFLIRSSICFLTDIPLGKLIPKLRFRYAMEIGNLLLLARIACWFLAQHHFAWLWLAPIFGGLMVPFYWQSYHTLVAEEAGHKVGRTVSLLGVLGRLVGAAGPIIGGFIITQLGWSFLFVVVFIAILTSGIPLLFMPRHPHDEVINWHHLLSQLKAPRYRQRAIAFFGTGIEGILQISWPLWLFLIIGSFEVLGILASISLVLSIAALFFIGKWIDRHGSRKILTLGAIANGIAWWLKLGAVDLARAFSTDLVSNLSGTTYTISLDATIYSLAVTRGRQEFILLREVAYHFGSIIALLLSIILVLLLPSFWWAIFALAAFGSLLSIKLAQTTPTVN
jgi:MFS family permease